MPPAVTDLKNCISLRIRNRYCEEAVPVSAGVDVQAHYASCGINGEGVGQYGVEGWIARYIYRDGRGFAQALQEAVLVAVDVIIKTNEIRGRVYAPDLRKRAAGDVVRSEPAVFNNVAVVGAVDSLVAKQEAVGHTVGALVDAHDLPACVDSEVTIVDSAGYIDRRKTTRAQQKAMCPAVSSTHVISYDLALRVNAGTSGLKESHGTWGIKRSERACTQQIDMSHAVRTLEISRDVALRTNSGVCVEYRAGRVKRSENAAAQHKSVGRGRQRRATGSAGRAVKPHDFAPSVDPRGDGGGSAGKIYGGEGAIA